MKNWYDKYINIPYKHLGDDPSSGMDCFNLCRYVYKQETGIQIPFASYDKCNIVDNDWFNKTTEQIIQNEARSNDRCVEVTTPKTFDFILFSIGSTNITNHCALYVGPNKILHTMINKPSWVSPYGGYYKQYTTGIYRWT